MALFTLLAAPLFAFAVFAIYPSLRGKDRRLGVAMGILIGCLALLVQSFFVDSLGLSTVFLPDLLRAFLWVEALPVLLPLVFFILGKFLTPPRKRVWSILETRNFLLGAIIPFGLFEAFSYASLPDPLLLVLPQVLRICVVAILSALIFDLSRVSRWLVVRDLAATLLALAVAALCLPLFDVGFPGLAVSSLLVTVLTALSLLVIEILHVRGVSSERPIEGLDPDAEEPVAPTLQ